MARRSIGVIIGHEISHGFDDSGSQYDAQGRLANWWTDDDLKKFREKGRPAMPWCARPRSAVKCGDWADPDQGEHLRSAFCLLPSAFCLLP
jgi:hypothetical protein